MNTKYDSERHDRLRYRVNTINAYQSPLITRIINYSHIY